MLAIINSIFGKNGSYSDGYSNHFAPPMHKMHGASSMGIIKVYTYAVMFTYGITYYF